MSPSDITNKLLHYCHVLREVGMSYGDYVEAAPAHPCARGIRTSCPSTNAQGTKSGAGSRKPHFAELGSKWFRELFTATLEVTGVPDALIRKVELMLGPVRFDTATYRSVLGTINIARPDLQAWAFQLPNVMELDPLKVSVRLAARPVTIRGQFIRPGREMQQLVAKVG